jgi:glycosyltransferase involved in cell wall biosynthesis
MAKVSVIMNCLNGEKYLREAMDSVFAQTYKDWEIIFWDNASTDNSAAIANSYGDKVKYYKNEQTVSLGQARNQAIEKSTGDYISFLDVDDVWLPDKLDIQLKLFENHPGVDFIYTNFYILDTINNRKYVAFNELLPQGKIFDKILVDYKIGIITVMIRKNTLERQESLFDPNLTFASDFDLFLRILHDSEVAYIDSASAIYRIHLNNYSLNAVSNNQKEIKYVLNKFKTRFNDSRHIFAGAIKLIISRLECNQAWMNLVKGDFASVRSNIGILLTLNPKAILLFFSSFMPKKLWFFLWKRWCSLKRFSKE